MEITSAEVQSVITECLYSADELEAADKDEKGVPAGAIVVDGIVTLWAFHPGRVADNKEKIGTMLLEMRDEFHVAKGGGWSFLNLCEDRHGNHWGEHRTMGQLCALAIASGQGKWTIPREMWATMPGGLPYIGFEVEVP